MKLIPKSVRDSVIDIMGCKSEEQKEIKSTLHGLDLDFVERYYPIALIEKEILNNDYDWRYYIVSISGIVEIKKSFTVEITFHDKELAEISNYNSSFGIQYSYNSTDPDLKVKIPLNMISEWMIEYFKKFDYMRMGCYAVDQMNPPILKNGFTDQFLKMIKDVG